MTAGDRRIDSASAQRARPVGRRDGRIMDKLEPGDHGDPGIVHEPQKPQRKSQDRDDEEEVADSKPIARGVLRA